MPRARIASGFGWARKPNLSGAGNSVSIARPSSPRALQQLRQMMIALRADHDVDHRRAAHDLLALGLRHAARDRDLHRAAPARGLVLGDAQAAELGIDLFGGLLADVAGVEDDEVGILRAGRLHESFRSQRVHHALGIVDVHLAAI